MSYPDEIENFKQTVIAFEDHVKVIEDRERETIRIKTEANRQLGEATNKLALAQKSQSAKEVALEEIKKQNELLKITRTKQQEALKELETKKTEVTELINKLSTLEARQKVIEAKEAEQKDKDEEIARNLSIIEKEKKVAKERQEILDRRESNIEASEKKLQRLTQI